MPKFSINERNAANKNPCDPCDPCAYIRKICVPNRFVLFVRFVFKKIIIRVQKIIFSVFRIRNCCAARKRAAQP